MDGVLQGNRLKDHHLKNLKHDHPNTNLNIYTPIPQGTTLVQSRRERVKPNWNSSESSQNRDLNGKLMPTTPQEDPDTWSKKTHHPVVYEYESKVISEGDQAEQYQQAEDSDSVLTVQQQWQDFLKSEEVQIVRGQIPIIVNVEAEQLQQDPPECTLGSFALNLIELIYAAKAPSESSNDNHDNLIQFLQESGFASFIVEVQYQDASFWQNFFNTGWPIFDLLGELQEKIQKNQKIESLSNTISVSESDRLSTVDEKFLSQLYKNGVLKNENRYVAANLQRSLPIKEAWRVLNQNQGPFSNDTNTVNKIAKATALTVIALSSVNNNQQGSLGSRDDTEFIIERIKEISDLIWEEAKQVKESVKKGVKSETDDNATSEGQTQIKIDQSQSTTTSSKGANLILTPLLHFLLSPFPLFSLLGLLDEQLNPRFRTEAIVIVGRFDRLEILHHYLHQQLRLNGGCIDRINFVIHNAVQKENEFIQQWVYNTDPRISRYYKAPSVYGKRLAKFYSFAELQNPYAVWVKIDDDIVFISRNAIKDMVQEKYFNTLGVSGERCSMVSANVINHSILSAVHNELGAVQQDYGPMIVEQNSESSDSEFWAPQIEKHPQSTCVWRTWQCAEWVHRSFIHHYFSKTLEAFQFSRYNFHLYGFGNFKESDAAALSNLAYDSQQQLHSQILDESEIQIQPLSNSRWSINMFAFKVDDITNLNKKKCAEDDESQMAYIQPHRMNRPACVVGSAIAVHFSYGNQEEGLIKHTDLMNSYRNITFYDYY